MIEQCQKALAANGFDVFVAKYPEHAREIFFDEIMPTVKAGLVSWGDSMTMEATGVLDELMDDPQLAAVDLFRTTSDAELGELKSIRSPFLPTSAAAEDIVAPALGEHTAEVLHDVGVSAEQIAALAEQGVIHQRRS